MVAAAQVEQTILELLRLSPGLRTAAIAKATAARRSTADERLKRLQAKGLIERDDASAGWRAPA
jgi:DNA-binding IclR family transcriptional regulator